MDAVIYYIDKIVGYMFRFLVFGVAQITDCAKIVHKMIKYFALFRNRKSVYFQSKIFATTLNQCHFMKID